MISKEELAKKGSAVGECLLNNSIFFAVGLVGGSFLSMRQKNLRPFVIAVGMGTLGNLSPYTSSFLIMIPSHT